MTFWKTWRWNDGCSGRVPEKAQTSHPLGPSGRRAQDSRQTGMGLPGVPGKDRGGEVSAKSHKRTEMGVWMARFPFVKTVEEFDFESQPSLDPKRIRELATSRSGKNLSGGGSGSGGDPKRLSDPLCGSPGPDRLPDQDAPGGAIGGEAQAALPVQASDHR